MTKKFLLIMMAGLLAMACATLTPAERAELARKVSAALDERRYEIDIRTMSPRHGVTKTVTDRWSLEVKGDTVVSYLPYFGRAYNVPYGGGKGLNFTAPIAEYTETVGQKNERRIQMVVTNDEDTYLYYIEVYENGNSFIDVQSKERDGISYSGNLLLE